MGISKRLIGAGATGSAGGITPSENFKVVTYTGTGASRSVSVGFQPDFVWIKHRGGTGSHSWTDSSRGNNLVLQSNETSTEASGQITLDSDGFTIGNNNALRNTNGEEYVAWCWKANGGTTSSNSDGSITSTVQANANLGFSIVLYQGTQSSATVGHGLGIAPKLVITKSRGTAQGWPTLVVGSDGTVYGGNRLNESNANSSGNGVGFFQNTAPTTSVFTLGASDESNPNGTNTIAYCLADVVGYQKIGSYTGNASEYGPIVETGFEPAYLMVKGVSHTGSWIIFDNKRNTTNPRTKILYADSNTSETTNANIEVDFLSNGFQLRGTDTDFNGSARTYIYWAVAADPDTEVPTLASSFNIETYTGTNAAQSITGLGFSPGMVWWKNRTGTNSHAVADIVRGANKYIHPDGTQAQNVSNGTSEDCISFDTDGFSIGTVQNAGSINTSGGSIVAWSWKADDNEPTIFGGPAKAVYKFEDNANDVTTNYNGTANSITYATGKFNKAAVFNGSTGDIDLPSDIESGTMAVSLWLYSDVNAPTDKIVIEFENGYGINFNTFASGKIAAQYANANANHTLSNSTISSGQWYHIAANFRSGASDLWVNGVKQTGGTASDYLTSDQNTIGSRRTGQFFDGMIDQVRIYNGNFQQLHVDELYAETASDNDDLTLGGPPETIISANANAGFSIVKYEGTGVTGTRVPHGLSSAPELWIGKQLTGNSINWQVLYSGFSEGDYLTLNTTAAKGNSANVTFDPTATTVKFHANQALNDSGEEYIGYAFHSVSGYSKIGSYTGSSSTVTVTVGFQLDFLMIKRSNGNNDWIMYDTLRSGSTSMDDYLIPNSSSAEYTNTSLVVNVTSTGFTIASGLWAGMNEAGGEYIYLAVAKNVPSNTTLADSFGVKTYTGNGGTQSINVGFNPDFVWIKQRNATNHHRLLDKVRGATKILYSSLNYAEDTESTGLTAFTSTGFDLGSQQSVNDNNDTYVAWGWKAGNTWQSNVDGTISSLTNVNTANGFSIVKYTGDGSTSKTVGHGLSSSPEMVFVKRLDSTADWYVWATPVMSITGSTSDYMVLNSSAAKVTAASATNLWGGNVPSATTIGVGDSSGSNASGGDYIAYCWHSVSGFSKVGSYSGTGSSNSITGLGFAPDYVMIKESSASESWRVFDNLRGATKRLFPDNNGAESAASDSLTSFDSDGFTLGSSAGVNQSGQTYLYMAFKQNATLSTEKANSFNITTYTGNATDNREITGVGFRPDLVWIKQRSGTQVPIWYDSVRGPGNYIYSSASDAEGFSAGTLKSFNSDGFTVGTSNSENQNSQTFVAWSWKAGNNWLNNNDGSVSSVVNYNTGNKFSIVRYEGTGSATTVGHGMGTTPTFIIGKTLDSSAKWRVYHSGLGGAANYLNLNDAFGPGSSSNVWNSTTPTSSVFSVGSDLSPSGEDMIAYVWADCDDYSKFGTYTGTGTAQTITTGFRPDFIITKDITLSSDNWRMYDTVRGLDEVLYPGLTNAEENNATGITAVTSTGFTLGTGNLSNRNNSDYIYIAFKMN